MEVHCHRDLCRVADLKWLNGIVAKVAATGAAPVRTKTGTRGRVLHRMYAEKCQKKREKCQ
jgi:hypothetical protein